MKVLRNTLAGPHAGFVVTHLAILSVLALNLTLAIGVAAASPSPNPECWTCHSPRFAVGPVDRSTACAGCHSVTSAHTYHNAGSNCGKCHKDGAGISFGFRIPAVQTPSGWFNTPAGAAASGSDLHSIHLNTTWLAAWRGGRCASCHKATACEACHGSVNHAAHDVDCTSSGCHSLSSTPALTVKDPGIWASNPTVNAAWGPFVFGGAWRSTAASSLYVGETVHDTAAAGAFVETTFQGNRIRLLGPKKLGYSGIADVYLDGARVASVTAYSVTPLYNVVIWDSGALPQGPHTVRVVHSGKRLAGTTSNYFAFDCLESSSAPSSFRPDCLGCHDADHGGAHESTINEQTLSGSYPGVGTYGPFFCTGCHETGLVTEHAKGSSSSAAAGCDNCHPSPRNTLTPWTQGCVQGGCHPAASATASQHGQMAVAHLPLAENADCVGCHNDGDLGALHLNANDGSNSSCFVCHTASGVPEVKNCVTCHPERVEPHGYEPADHQSDVAADTVSGTVPTGVAFGPVTCDECHLTELFPEHQRPTSSAVSAACDACHPSPVNTLTPAWAKGCVQGGCHPAASTTAQHANMNASHAQPAENESCMVAGCHDQGDLAAVHADAAPVDGCTYCHSTTTVPNVKICTDCHGTPHGDLAEAHTANEPGGMFWANTGAYAACTQCHYLDVRTEHAKASSGSLGCPACHADGGPIDSLPGGVWNKQCSACHSSIHANYDGEHIAYGQDCNPCHGEPEDARDFHPTCSVAPGDGYTPITPVAPCHVSPDVVPTPQLGPPFTNGYWCRSCHPEE